MPIFIKMAFPKPILPDGRFHEEDGRDFNVVQAKWGEHKGTVSHIFHAAGDSDPSWNWMTIPEKVENILTLRASINLETDGDLGFIAHDGANTIEFDTNMIPQGYGIISWGNGGETHMDWNSIRAYSGGKGIPVNKPIATQHVKHDNWSYIELTLMHLEAHNSLLHWQYQYQAEDDTEIVVMCVFYIHKPIREFRKIGFRCTQRITTQALHAHYN